jgi:hypothetical protein
VAELISLQPDVITIPPKRDQLPYQPSTESTIADFNKAWEKLANSSKAGGKNAAGN